MDISIFNLVLYTIVRANDVLNPTKLNFTKEHVRDVVLSILTDEEKAEFETANIEPCLYDVAGSYTEPRGATEYITELVERSTGDLYGHDIIDNHCINELYIAMKPRMWRYARLYLQSESATHGELFERIDRYFETNFGDGE